VLYLSALETLRVEALYKSTTFTFTFIIRNKNKRYTTKETQVIAEAD